MNDILNSSIGVAGCGTMGLPMLEVLLKNKITGKEYNSDAEALTDLQDPNSETKPGDITRSVKINVKLPPFGAKTNL